MRISDWSSDVCSSDLDPGYQIFRQFGRGRNPAVAEQLDDEVAEQRVVGLLDPDLRGGRQARAQIGQRHPPGRQWLVGDDQQGLAPLLRLVPGVKERFLVMTLGVVEQPAAGLADEDAAQKAAAGLARTRSEEHTSELQSLMRISYAVFCLK